MISLGQERLWFLNLLDPDDPAYRVVVTRRLHGPLDADALTAAFSDVAARHDSLRTRFPDRDGLPAAVVDPPGPVPIERIELADAAEAERVVTERTQTPFELASAPPYRVTLIRLAADDHVLCVVLHHIIGDGWSLNVLMDDLARCYVARRDGVAAELPELAVRYGDYAAEQRSAGSDLDYWTAKLAGAAPLELPADRPRPARRSSAGAEVTFTLPASLAAELVRLARARRSTVFMVLLAAYQVFLSRHSGQDDLVVGSPTAGRDRPELEPMVGLFASTLVLRGDLAGDPTFAELLLRTRRTVSEAMAHREAPIERILSALDIERDLSRTPLFQTMFAMHNSAVGYEEAERFADLGLGHFPHGAPPAMVDLRLDLWPRAGGMSGAFFYSTDLFEAATVRRFAARFTTLLRAIVASPEVRLSALELLPVEEREVLLSTWNRTGLEVPDASVAELVLEQALVQPDAVAVECGGERRTYGELAGSARRIADGLLAQGAGPGSVVALRLGRTAELPAHLLGVMLTGAAYLPIDPALPPDRIAYLLEDSGAGIVVTDDGLSTRAGAGAVPAGSAYVLYTSGSTGRPKGVTVPHSALTNLIAGMGDLVGRGDVWLGSTSLSFDISALELYLPLVTGGRLVLADDETARDGAALAGLIAGSGVTHVQATPSGWSMLLTAGLDPAGLTALAGGEALPPQLARRLRGGVARLFNMYGPTETTIWSTAWEVPREPGRVSIGRPIANTYVRVLDAGGGIVPVGVPGELAIGGAGVATGYLGNPELTAERFVTDPYPTHHTALTERGGAGRRGGSGVYLTGDRVRWLEDGTLEFLGRADGQVKLRGHRIELGEVEAALESHPGVKHAAAVVRGDELVAYVVGNPPDLLEHAAAWLPAAMVPGTVVSLDALPMTANGKVDRLALPAPDRPAPGRGGRPSTALERLVAEIFAEVLGIDKPEASGTGETAAHGTDKPEGPETRVLGGGIGVDDDFFALGGHSLLGTQVIARLAAAGWTVPLRALFTHPTPARLATILEAAAPTPGGTKERSPGPSPAQGLQTPEAGPGLSPAQERLWFLHRLEPDDASYNMYIVRRLQGALDRDALHEAITGLVARHEQLRTRFPEQDGRPVTVVEAPGRAAVEYFDVSDEAEARERVAERTNAPLDLPAAPPIRFTVMRLAPDDHVLCVVVHHIVADGWSIGVLLGDLAELYGAHRRGVPSALAPLIVARRGRDSAEALDYWRAQLAEPSTLDLHTDRRRTPGITRGDHLMVDIPADLAEALERTARRQRVTLFMVLLSAYQVLLSRHTGQDDILVGSPTAGRDRVELEPLVGYFTRTLVLRGDLSGDPTLDELLDRTRGTTLDAMAHQDVPFEQLVAELDLERDLSRKPVFQTMLTLNNQVPGSVRDAFDDLRMSFFHDGYRQAKFDLAVEAWSAPGLLRLAIGYDAGLFDGGTVARMAERFGVLLRAVADPDHRHTRVSALPVLTADDHALIAASSGRLDPAPTAPVPAMIRQAFAAHAERTALVCGEQSVTYAELERRVTARAAELGSCEGDIVAVRLGRSIEAVVAMLAIWRTGAAYLPLDPAYPAERLRHMIADSGAVEPGVSGDGAHPGLAYVIYTSGSTGVPKRVAVEQAGLAARVTWMRQAYGLRPGDRIVQLASLSFDTHAEELYPALASGATVVLMPDGGATLPDLLAQDPQISVLDLPTAYFHQLVDLIDEVNWPKALRLVILGGEQVNAAAVTRWRARFGDRVRLVNTYGPTEATIIATAAELTGGDPHPPIGRPIHATTIKILGPTGAPTPPGAPGELHIGGPGVARGYGEWFRTGDRVRLRQDGHLEFLGRMDDQVKVRGFRIEPGEVERCLLAHPEVRQAVVLARAGELVAYVVGDMPEHLALPQYLIPTRWVQLDALPLTRNGKLHKAALPHPSRPEGAGTAPRTDAEELVADVWADVLGADKVGAFDDFFVLGGHSLLAVRVAARLRALAGVEVPIRTLFTHRTVAALASAVEEALIAEVSVLSDEQVMATLDPEDRA